MPNALNTLLMVERVMELFPFSNLHIWERFTPTLSPNSSCVRFCLRRFLFDCFSYKVGLDVFFEL
ncbi:hypothetical protein EVA_21916 [gut metagenome]|uniref:Uncharacterized protein n=1 Tax=gut metagenome TaxID=749906 RepID=J9FK21_9ZZZZ